MAAALPTGPVLRRMALATGPVLSRVALPAGAPPPAALPAEVGR